MDLLEARGISKRYGTEPVLAGVDLRLEAGGLLLVTGRSGSGKSTLFNLLALLDVPTSGRVLFRGRDVTRLPEAARARLRLSEFGVIFQDHNLLPDHTLLENVALPARLAREPRARARARELLARVGLERHAEKLPGEVSLGQAQRAAVVRALINRPSVIFADEPTSSLDEESAEAVLSLLEGIPARGQVGVLIVSHDELVRRRIPDRLRLAGGVLTPEGMRAGR